MAARLGSTAPLPGTETPQPANKPHIFLVCSPQGHVGTTLTARLLLDFSISRTGAARGFDTNHLDPGLASVFPREVDIVDLASTRGQMALFDRLIETDATTKVVDLWHVSYGGFFKQAEDIGFFQELRQRDLMCSICLLLDPRGRFVPELSSLHRRCAGADIVPIENEALAHFDEKDGQAFTASIERRLVIPKLDPTVHHLLTHPEILIHRFVGMLVPDKLRALQEQIGQALLPVFEQFEIVEVASELRLPVRSLLPRRPVSVR